MIRRFSILFDFVFKYIILEKTFKISQSWKIPIIPKLIIDENKENAIKTYYKIIKNIKIEINNQKLLFYTDESKTPGGTEAAEILMSTENVYKWAKCCLESPKNAYLPALCN